MARKGPRLEYLVASVFQGQGYLVRREVPLKYGTSGQDATDIDVLGIRFTQPFQPHLIICDCKDRQRAKPYERIFWAKGLASFVNASETYVALPRASLEIITFARSGGVRVFTQEILQNAYSKLYGTEQAPYGIANNSVFEGFENRMSSLMKKERRIATILFEAKTLYLAKDPYVALNISLSNLETCAENLKKVEDVAHEVQILWKYATAELTILISLLLLYIASDVMGLSKAERERRILDRLTYGDLPPGKAEAIFQSAKEYALEMVKALSSGTTQASLLPFDLGKMEPPLYAYDVCGLVERALASPALYHELPQLVDFLLFEQSLQNRGFSDEQYRRMFPGPNQDERLKIARNIFSFLRDSVGLDLSIFWPRQEGNMPR